MTSHVPLGCQSRPPDPESGPVATTFPDGRRTESAGELSHPRGPGLPASRALEHVW